MGLRNRQDPLGLYRGTSVDLINGNIVYGTGSADEFKFADVAFAVAGRTAPAALSLPLNDTHIGNIGANTIDAGSGHDVLKGGGGNDLLYGGTGHDTLYGHDDIDILIGGTGNDLLFGGFGGDRFVTAPGNGTDTIHFEQGIDELDLRAFGFVSVTQVRALATAVSFGLSIDLPGAGSALRIIGLDTPSDLLAGDVLL